MKKIYLSTAVIFTAVAACVTQALAAAPSITVKSSRSEVAYTYTSAKGSTEATADASKLFGGFADASVEEYMTENLTITSESKDSDNIEVALRFSVENSDLDCPLIDYYDFRITDEAGKVIYSRDDEESTDAEVSSKEIPFGVFNKESVNETRKYTVEYKIDEVAYNNVAEDKLEALSVEIVSRVVDMDKTESDFNVMITSEMPSDIAGADNTVVETVVAAVTSEPESAETAQFRKTCGVDIAAGRYIVTGNGIVKIESADGVEKSSTVVTDGSNTNIEGVNRFIATITDGDVITALPLEGHEKPSIRFEKTNASSAAVPATAVSGEADAAPTNRPVKSNPRTGENAQAVLVGGLMLAAAAAIGILEVIKRRKAGN